MTATLDRLFLRFSIEKLEQYSAEIEKCLARLNESQIWARGGSNENAVGNLILHLCGNVNQRIAAIAGRRNDRVRELEFSARDGLSSAELIEKLRAAASDAIATLSALTAERLGEEVMTGEFKQSVLESIYHMEVHFALHSGQIYYATKQLTGEDLGFYKPPAPKTHV
jgi:hypothetical protein